MNKIFLLLLLFTGITLAQWNPGKIILGVDVNNPTHPTSLQEAFQTGFSGTAHWGRLNSLHLNTACSAYKIRQYSTPTSAITESLLKTEFDSNNSTNLGIVFFEGGLAGNPFNIGKTWFYEFGDQPTSSEWSAEFKYGASFDYATYVLSTPLMGTVGYGDGSTDYWGITNSYLRLNSTTNGMVYNSQNFPRHYHFPGRPADSDYNSDVDYHVRIRIRGNASYQPIIRIKILRNWLVGQPGYEAFSYDINYTNVSSTWQEIHLGSFNTISSNFPATTSSFYEDPYSLTIEYYGSVGNYVDIDYIRIDNEIANTICYNYSTSDIASYINLIDIGSGTVQGLDSFNNIELFKLADEPKIYNYPSISELMGKFTNLTPICYVSGPEGHKLLDNEFFIKKTNNNGLLQFHYPIKEGIGIQSELNESIIQNYGYINFLKDGNDAATTEDVPFIPFIQTHTDTTTVPLANEVKLLTYLSFAYNADGVIYYPYWPGSFTANSGVATTTGALNTRFQNTITNINEYITDISSTLRTINLQNGYSIHLQNVGTGEVLHTFEVKAYQGGSWTKLSSSTSYAEVCFFANALGEDFVFLVNRDVSDANGRIISGVTNLGSGYVQIRDVATGTDTTVSNGQRFSTHLQPGQGKLYKITEPSAKMIIKDEDSKNEFELNENFPNPFNPTTKFDYYLPEKSNVVFEVYDAIGQKVSTLVSGTQSRGNHTAIFEAGALSSGIYFYHLRAMPYSNESSPFIKTGKMILSK